jgi:hypothetical protein
LHCYNSSCTVCLINRSTSIPNWTIVIIVSCGHSNLQHIQTTFLITWSNCYNISILELN